MSSRLNCFPMGIGGKRIGDSPRFGGAMGDAWMNVACTFERVTAERLNAGRKLRLFHALRSPCNLRLRETIDEFWA